MTVDGFEEGDYVKIDPSLFRQYVPPYVESFEVVGHPLEDIDDLLDAVITNKKEPENNSKSYNYHVKIIDNQNLGEYSCLDDCFIKACQHCRNRMVFHQNKEQWICPFCYDDN